MAEQLVPVSNVPFKPSADSAITAVYPTPGQDMPMPENRSMAEILWDSGEWDDFMAELSPADRNALAYNREFLCRPKQLIDPEEVSHADRSDRRQGIRKNVHGRAVDQACKSTSWGACVLQ